MNKYAVLIGNSQFPDEADKIKLPDLACPERDVDGLAKVLSSERGEFDVLPLKNQSSYQVLRELQRKVKQAQPDDLLLLYYSGHGKPNEKAGMLHLTTSDTVLAELETSAIPINRVYDILSTGRCKKIVIILDCCYSGAAGQGHKGDLDAQLQQLNNSRGTYLVTASTGMQVANETDGYSLFTKHLIAGLETGDADKGGDGLVDMDELYDYVHSKVKAENPNQEPTRHIDDQRGDLIIAKSGRDSRKERFEKIRLLLLELEKQHEDVAEIRAEAVFIAKTPFSQLSTTRLQKDELLDELLRQKITLLSFVRKWDWITFVETNTLQSNEKAVATSENTSKSLEQTYKPIINIVDCGKDNTFVAKPETIFEPSIKSETASVSDSKIPEDSMLRRHYLTNLRTQITANMPSCPTDSVLRRHYDAIIENEVKEQLSKLESWKVIGKYKVKDGLAIDTKTGLMWLRFAYGQTWKNFTAEGEGKRVNYETAFKVTKEFNEKGGYGGYKDWRLPCIDELKTLIDKVKGNKGICIDADVFPKNPKHYTWFWSSTADNGDYAAFVHFNRGWDDLNSKHANNYVRLVRSEKNVRENTVQEKVALEQNSISSGN